MLRISCFLCIFVHLATSGQGHEQPIARSMEYRVPALPALRDTGVLSTMFRLWHQLLQCVDTRYHSAACRAAMLQTPTPAPHTHMLTRMPWMILCSGPHLSWVAFQVETVQCAQWHKPRHGLLLARANTCKSHWKQFARKRPSLASFTSRKCWQERTSSKQGISMSSNGRWRV